MAESAYTFAQFVDRVEPHLEPQFNTRMWRAEIRGVTGREPRGRQLNVELSANGGRVGP
jgi:hypothetical protein